MHDLGPDFACAYAISELEESAGRAKTRERLWERAAGKLLSRILSIYSSAHLKLWVKENMVSAAVLFPRRGKANKPQKKNLFSSFLGGQPNFSNFLSKQMQKWKIEGPFPPKVCWMGCKYCFWICKNGIRDMGRCVSLCLIQVSLKVNWKGPAQIANLSHLKLPGMKVLTQDGKKE